MGRFIQPDSLVQDISDPQSWNRYAYVRNNPLKYTDPSGHYIDKESDTDSGSDPMEMLGGDPVDQNLGTNNDPAQNTVNQESTETSESTTEQNLVEDTTNADNNGLGASKEEPEQQLSSNDRTFTISFDSGFVLGSLATGNMAADDVSGIAVHETAFGLAIDTRGDIAIFTSTTVDIGPNKGTSGISVGAGIGVGMSRGTIDNMEGRSTIRTGDVFGFSWSATDQGSGVSFGVVGAGVGVGCSTSTTEVYTRIIEKW